tara:strand:+ start:73 stop:654 length:582 start_codon:yes stop_codon:yes gene_type:complete
MGKNLHGGKEYEFHQLLYLFDEVDTSNDILLDRKIKDNTNKQKKELHKKLLTLMKNKDSGDVSDELFDAELLTSVSTLSKISGKDDLNLGTILEKMSGINQMWGRKMIFITNYPDKLDKAFLREGRIDFNCELSYSETKDILKIITNFYRTITKQQKRVIRQFFTQSSTQYTPAQITNLCKIYSTPEKLINNL